jgi:small GTP-binding protein
MALKQVKSKILLLGDEAVGKTSLIRKFVLDQFDDKYIATIGTKVTKKDLVLKSGNEQTYLTLMIWDILGQKGYRSIQKSSFRGADGVILICDFTRRSTYDDLQAYWLKLLGDVVANIPIVFVANKCDLKDKAEFTLEEVKAIADPYGSEVYASSAKTGENVENLFHTIGKMVITPSKEERQEKTIDVESLPEKITVIEAADRIISDFCKGFGGQEEGMPVIRQQFNNAGVDIRNPTKDGLLKVVDLLAEVERGFKDEVTVNNNRVRRRLLLNRVK